MKKNQPDDRRLMALPDAFTGWAGYLLRQTALRAQAGVVERLTALAIRPPHHSVLAIIEDAPCSQVALAAGLQSDRTTMVGIIDELESMGLVERRISPVDRRAHEVTLTDAGRAVLVESRALISAADEDLLAPLDETERVQFRAFLRRVIDHYDAYHGPKGG